MEQEEHLLNWVKNNFHIVDTFIGRKFQPIGTNSNYSSKEIYELYLSVHPKSTT